MNIKPKNKTKGKLPQLSNWSFTYPVPVKIEIILNKIDLGLNESESFIARYADKIIIDINIIFKKEIFLTFKSISLIFIIGKIKYKNIEPIINILFEIFNDCESDVLSIPCWVVKVVLKSFDVK